MKLTRQKTFSKMSKKTFEKKESEITNKYKKGLGHTAGAGINAAIGVSLAKHAKNSKLAAAGTAVSAANAGYHAYNAGKNFKEGFKIARDPKYQEKLDEAIKIQDKKDDKELEKLQKAEEIVKAQKKKLHLYSDQEEQKEFASVKSMKKFVGQAAEAAQQEDPKKLLKLAARVNRQGLNKTSDKYIYSKGGEKVRKSIVNKLIGKNASPEEKKMVSEGLAERMSAAAKEAQKVGGKAPKLKGTF